MKKIFYLFVTLIFLISCGNVKNSNKNNNKGAEEVKASIKENNTEKNSIKFIFPDGLPALSILEMYADNKQIDENIIISYEQLKTVDALVSEVFKNDADKIAIVPSNMAVQLYNKGTDYEILGTVTWGSLYLMSNGDINSLKELEGKKVGVIGRGQTPDIVFRHILSKNKIDIEKLEIEYYNTGSELAAAIAAGNIKNAVLSEPAVSVLKSKNKNIKTVTSLNEEWKKIYSTKYGFPQGTLVIRKSTAEKYPELAAKLSEEMKNQNTWFKEEKYTEEYIKKSGVSVPFNLISVVFKNSNINFLGIDETKEEYENYYRILFEFEPKTIGGKIPDEKIYFKK